MSLKSKIRGVLNDVYGSFDTTLEHQYEEKVTESLINGDINSKKTWMTYNQVILELKHNLKDQLRVKELQYRLTDVENPKTACIEVLEHVKDRSPELNRLYYKISNFL